MTDHPTQPEQTTPSGRKSSRNEIVIVLVILLVALGSVAVFLLNRASAGDDAAQTPEVSEQQEELTPEEREASEAAIALMRAEPRRVEGDPYAKGDTDAPVVLIEFADYRCPFCAQHTQEVSPMLGKYIEDGTLRVEWRDLPVFGEDSVHIHHAARAAGRQGLFWEYHDAVFAATPLQGHREWSDAELREVAEQVGIPDLDKWEADRASEEISAEVEADRAHAANDLGITGTPAFILGDVYIPGAYPLATFTQQIIAQAEKAEN